MRPAREVGDRVRVGIGLSLAQLISLVRALAGVEFRQQDRRRRGFTRGGAGPTVSQVEGGAWRKVGLSVGPASSGDWIEVKPMKESVGVARSGSRWDDAPAWGQVLKWNWAERRTFR